MARISGKRMAFAVSDDNVVEPTPAEIVSFVRSSTFNGSRPSTDVTAALDEFQEHVSGIPGATFQVSGPLDVGGDPRMRELFDSGDTVRVRFWFDLDQPDDFVGGSAFSTSYQPQSQYDGSPGFQSTLQLTGPWIFEDPAGASSEQDDSNAKAAA